MTESNLTLEGYVDDAKIVGTLRAAVKRKRWNMTAAVTVTKYLSAGAAGAAITLAATYSW